MTKKLTIIGITLVILQILSCQTEDVSNTDQESTTTNEVQLINEAYAVDLENYKDTPVVFEDFSIYTIEEVLTDPILFNTYEKAYTHHIEENLDLNTKILYVSSEDPESAEEMMLTITNDTASRSAKSNASNSIDYSITLYDNNNQKGQNTSIHVKGTKTGTSQLAVETYYNVGTDRRNKANSYKTVSHLSNSDNSDIITTAYGYADRDGRNRRTNLGGHRTSKNLSGTSVGNDNIESIGLIHYISN